jgi:hypothetical protein
VLLISVPFCFYGITLDSHSQNELHFDGKRVPLCCLGNSQAPSKRRIRRRMRRERERERERGREVLYDAGIIVIANLAAR